MTPLQERPQFFVIPSKLSALYAITLVFSLPQYTQLCQLVVSYFTVALSEKKRPGSSHVTIFLSK
jgi:hypothetical protein